MSRRPGAPRGVLPPAPLLAIARQRVMDSLTSDHTQVSEAPIVSAMAAELGVNRRTVHRWQAGALIRPMDADRYACHLGLHPAEVWGMDAWLNTTEERTA